MPRKPGKGYKRCKWCSAALSKTSKKLTDADISAFKSPVPKPVKAGDSLCATCLLKASENAREALEDLTNANAQNPPDENPTPSKKLKVNVPTASSGGHTCIVCGNKKGLQRGFNSKRLKPEARTRVFAKTGVFVPAKSRACTKHFEGKYLKQECYARINQSGVRKHYNGK